MWGLILMPPGAGGIRRDGAEVPPQGIPSDWCTDISDFALPEGGLRKEAQENLPLEWCKVKE